MAAEVVKQYLLPMFEADSKSYIRDKRAKERRNLGLAKKDSLVMDDVIGSLKPIEGEWSVTRRGGERVPEGSRHWLGLQGAQAEREPPLTAEQDTRGPRNDTARAGGDKG